MTCRSIRQGLIVSLGLAADEFIEDWDEEEDDSYDEDEEDEEDYMDGGGGEGAQAAALECS